MKSTMQEENSLDPDFPLFIPVHRALMKSTMQEENSLDPDFPLPSCHTYRVTFKEYTVKLCI